MPFDVLSGGLASVAVVGGPALAPAAAPAPESPVGMSRSARGLKQLPSGFSAGGLAALQQVQQGIIDAFRRIEPGPASELAVINNTLGATVKTLLLPVMRSLHSLNTPACTTDDSLGSLLRCFLQTCAKGI